MSNLIDYLKRRHPDVVDKFKDLLRAPIVPKLSKIKEKLIDDPSEFSEKIENNSNAEKPKPHICTKCDKGFTTVKRLKKHFGIVHERETNPYQMQKCKYCDYTSTRQSGGITKHETKCVKAHTEIVHGKITPFLCTICSYKCNMKQVLENHLSVVHNDMKLHVCSHCAKSFGHINTLKNHIAVVHEGIKPFQCNVCAEMFSAKCELNLHITAVHEGKKLNKCPECEKSFGFKSNLTTHIRTVHEGKTYQCDLCSSKFSQQATLKGHVAVVHEGKRHICSICGVGISSLTYLKRHITAVHEGKKPYMCELCSFFFPTKLV